MNRLKFYAATFAIIIGLLTIFNQTARAQMCMTNPVVVNNLDSGAGSLRQAVIDACPGSTITFNVTGTIPLTTGQFVIDKNLTIQGPGASVLTLQNTAGTGANNRIFFVNSGVTAAISGLTISDGDPGGILNAGNLTVTSSTVSNNHRAAGISNSGNLIVINSIISNNGLPFAGDPNGGGAGGIFSFGASLTIINSTITGNLSYNFSGGFAEYGGGGVYSDNLLTITGSTISGNFAASPLHSCRGGGLLNLGTATITNSTVSGNQINNSNDEYGGGIYNSGTLSLVNSTVAQNKVTLSNVGSAIASGFGIANDGTVTARNSIIAGNTVMDNGESNVFFGPDFEGMLTSQGYNLIGDPEDTTITGDTTGNIVGTHAAPIDARLAPLADNGGPTQTHALLPGSIAIDAGSNALVPTGIITDQRGVQRIIDGNNDGTAIVDMGAFEASAPTAAGATLSGHVTTGRRGLSRAIVYLQGLDGTLRIMRTNPFGYFQFEDVAAGQTYIVSVMSKQYQFEPQVITITGDLGSLLFTPPGTVNVVNSEDELIP